MTIHTENLTKFYGPVQGIRALQITVEKGEIFGFLGPNGAGKTTTIRLLLDLIRPTAGRAMIFGEDVGGKSLSCRERIGYLPGEFPSYPSMTAGHFLDYLASFRKRAPSLREALSARLALPRDALQKKIKHLSHGNRRKLGIIHALEHDPDLAILDEPSLGLDPLMQEAFYDVLRDFRERGKTIFFSSHNLPEVEKVCQRVAIIRHGRLVTSGSIEALKKKLVRRMILVFDHVMDPATIHLHGARLLEASGDRCTFIVDGDIKSLLPRLENLPLMDIIFPEPDLEDVFLSYYQGGAHD